MTTTFNLKAVTRTNLGSADSRRVRKGGQVPAVIYNNGKENLNIAVDAKDFEHQYFKGNIFTTVVDLDLDGKKLQVIAKKVEVNPVTDKPEHIDFIQFSKDKSVKVKAKLNFINQDKSIGLKRGGFLHIVARKVEVLCAPGAIVHSIDIDVAPLRVGHKIRSQDLHLPENVKLAGKDGFLIASIIGRGSKEDDKADAAAAAAEGAAPAAAKAPAAKAAAPAAAKDAAKKPAAKK